MKIVCSFVTLGLLATASLLRSASQEIPPAFGPYINLQAADFRGMRTYGPKDQIVGTYYFYWYNVHTGEHMTNGNGTDALTTHPASMEDFAYTSVAWHKKQLSDMIDARIDIVFPVFWGAPSEQATNARMHWSYAGLPPLVKAREELLKERKRPPLIGMFYDTSTLQYNSWGLHIDLTTLYGQQWFYATIRDFFSLIPREHWAMLYGKPMVLLYSAGFAQAHNQAVIDYTRSQFAKDFGGKQPWIAAEVSWNVKADSKVAWGGALGLKNPGVASLGPGYDHSAVPGRQPLVVDRQDGKFYEEQWLKFLRRQSQFVMIETWNEFHEGTDIAESREYGRQYIELTRKYASLFKRGWAPKWPKGPFTGAKTVSITLNETNASKGLRLIDNEDGLTAPAIAAGRPARAMKNSATGGHYIYFAVDDSYKWASVMNTLLDVEYFDAAKGSFTVEYDGNDLEAPFNGAYTRCEESVRLTGSRTWKKTTFRLLDASFLNSQNRGADFRLVLETPEFLVSALTLRQKPVSYRSKRSVSVSGNAPTAPGAVPTAPPRVPQIPVRQPQ